MKSILFLFPLALLFIYAAPALETITLGSNYNVTILGTSNMHDWDAKVEKVTGQGQASFDADGCLNINTIDLKMEVKSIKTKSNAMNKNTYKALKADAHPSIGFHLTLPVQSIKVGQAAQTLSAKGNITVAGVTKPITMQIKVNMPSKTLLQVEGTQALKMTDFDVQPPVAMMGVMKTGDDITIQFKTSFNIKP